MTTYPRFASGSGIVDAFFGADGCLVSLFSMPNSAIASRRTGSQNGHIFIRLVFLRQNFFGVVFKLHCYRLKKP